MEIKARKDEIRLLKEELSSFKRKRKEVSLQITALWEPKGQEIEETKRFFEEALKPIKERLKFLNEETKHLLLVEDEIQEKEILLLSKTIDEHRLALEELLRVQRSSLSLRHRQDPRVIELKEQAEELSIRVDSISAEINERTVSMRRSLGQRRRKYRRK